MDILNSYLFWFQEWSVPNMWLILSATFLVLGLFYSTPYKLSSTENASFLQTMKTKIKHLAIVVFVLVGFILPLSVWLTGVVLYQNNVAEFSKSFLNFMLDGFLSVWEFPIIGLGIGYLFSIGYSRYFVPWLSKIKRKFTMRQSGEELSDIRVEENSIGTKNYKPNKYYKKGFMFFGLDNENKPIYEPLDDWRSRHLRLVGPTQTGKGVEIGLQLDQSIRNGDTVFFIDPKPDKHAKAIMKRAAKESGRNFVECDLNESGRGKYAPFFGGEKRDVRARLMYALGLRDTGTDADFYKSSERQIIDALGDKWDGQLKSLRDLLTSNQYIEDQTKRATNYINEFISINTFTPDIDRGRTGLSIERCLKENAVVYIRGNLDDDVINMASTLLLMELVQECKRLAAIKKGHTFIAIDEIAFLINEKIADALATVAGFDTNILLAYQAEGDLLNLKDKTLNGKAITSRVKVNCKYSLYYMAQDFETAKVMADDSGTIQKSVTRSQKVNIGDALEETWDDSRDIHRVEENLITANKAKMLPERVGVLYRPAKNALLCFTCWLDIDLNKWGDQINENIKDKAPKSQQAKKPTKQKKTTKPNTTEKSSKQSSEKDAVKQKVTDTNAKPSNDKKIIKQEDIANKDQEQKPVDTTEKTESKRKTIAIDDF